MKQYFSELVLSYLLFFKWSNTCQSWCSHIFCFFKWSNAWRSWCFQTFCFLNGTILGEVGALRHFGLVFKKKQKKNNTCRSWCSQIFCFFLIIEQYLSEFVLSDIFLLIEQYLELFLPCGILYFMVHFIATIFWWYVRNVSTV